MGCDRYRKAEMIDLLHALERRPPTRDRVGVLNRSRCAFESGPKTCPGEPTARRGMSFHRPASRDGMIVSEVGVPATAPGAVRSGIALTNTSETATEVSLELTALDPTSTGVAASLTIPASGQVARFIDEFFPALTPPFSGILRIAPTSTIPAQSSAMDLAVIGLRLTINGRGDIVVTTTPPSDEDSTTTASDLFFPHLVDSAGWTSQFIVYGRTPGQTMSGLLVFTGQDG